MMRGLGYCMEEPGSDNDINCVDGFPALVEKEDTIIATYDSNLSLWNNAKTPFALCNVFLGLTSTAAMAFGLFSFIMEVTVRLDNRLCTATLAISSAVVIFGATSLICCTLGCVAAQRRSLRKLQFYSTIFGAFIVLEVTITTLGIVQQNRVKTDAQNIAEWSVIIRNYQDDTIRDDIDNIQKHLKCCGFRNFHDWDMNPYYSCKTQGYSRCSVPASCCKLQGVLGSTCVLGVRNPRKSDSEISEYIHQNGCLDAIQDWYKYTLILLSFALMFMAVVQFLIRALTNTLIQELQKQQRAEEAESVTDSTTKSECDAALEKKNFHMTENYRADIVQVSKVSTQQRINVIVVLDHNQGPARTLAHYTDDYLPYKIPEL